MGRDGGRRIESARHGKPKDETSWQPCVWMDAGLLAYRLCDRDFACESCPLALALQNVPQPGPRDASRRRRAAARRMAGTPCPDDRCYTGRHQWLRETGIRRFRVGVDAFAGALLCPALAVHLPAAGSAVAAGEVACRVELPGGPVPLEAPLSGRVDAVNARLRGEPGLMGEDPWGRGWIMEVAGAPPRGVLDAAAMSRQAALDQRRLRRLLGMRLLAANGDLGPVMADGGELITELWRMLGPKAYLEIVRDFVG